MNRRRADAVVGGIVGLVGLSGLAFTWDAYRRQRALDGSMGSMMDSAMGTMHGPNPLWVLLGTIVVVALIGGAYLVVRPELHASTGGTRSGTVESSAGTDSTAGMEAAPPSNAGSDGAPPSDARSDAAPPSDAESNAAPPSGARSDPVDVQSRPRVLDLLPEDERRILEPVLESPGITQIELRDRSGFSKSKVSQTASALEKRGLLYRERQGRTYRIYPSEDLEG